MVIKDRERQYMILLRYRIWGKKKIQMNLFPKQKETQRHRKQTYGHLKGKGDGVSHSIMSDSLRPHVLQSTRFLCPWNSPGKNTRVGSHCLLQGIFPTQGSNPSHLSYRQILYWLSHQGSQIRRLGLTYKTATQKINDQPGPTYRTGSYIQCFVVTCKGRESEEVYVCVCVYVCIYIHTYTYI